MQKLLLRYMNEYGINTNEQKETPLFFNSRHVKFTTVQSAISKKICRQGKGTISQAYPHKTDSSLL